MSRAAVALIGDPVAHSVSPAMQRAAFERCGLQMDYVAVRVPLHELVAAFDGLRERFVGLNVTRPLKEAVIPLLDRIGPKAAAAGSVNTVVFGAEAYGHSTDGTGFLRALARAAVDPGGRTVVLGTGGAARAVAAALIQTGGAVSVSGRNEEAGATIAAELGASFIAREDFGDAASTSDLLVNATPIGQAEDDQLPFPSDTPLGPGTAVFDLVYRPRRTALLRLAEARGCATIEGIEMLIEQGARSFELWTDRPAPVDVMRRAAYAALDGVAE
jgi:shikimate dehydrogenase